PWSLEGKRIETLSLAWGVAHWDATRIPRCATLPEERL
ncbi:tRNA glutamyl-Q(34) synthetase GluQRS, partial [Pseudomonas aeruginosa]|nr:tRNA glutamyl-Q(34) synthetase GluQRS [Pseudomonas aeruginosa]